MDTLVLLAQEITLNCASNKCLTKTHIKPLRAVFDLGFANAKHLLFKYFCVKKKKKIADQTSQNVM